MRVALDATPLLGLRTGIGRYVEHLLEGLAAIDDLDLRAAAFSLRGRGELSRLPPGIHQVRRPVPARLLHRAWLRGALPPAEWVTGRCDVVHGTNFVLPPPRKAAGVVTVHDLTYVRYPDLVDAASRAYRDLVPRALKRAAAVITPSQAVADEMIDRYRLPGDLVRATPLGVDDSWFRSAPRPAGLPGEYLLAVGTREPRKGLDVLLAAYRILLATEPDAPPLVLVGARGWGADLDRAGIPPDRLVLTGYVSGGELRSAVSHAAALAFPSRYEGFGLPPLEALAAGTPVVASDIPAVREVVGGHATLVRIGDAEALAEALRATLADPPTTERREAGRRHAAGFTWQACARGTAATYRDVSA